MDIKKDIFYARENITNMTKEIITKSNLKNLTDSHKQKIIKILINNMNNIFKSIDISKINNNNINTILNQFKIFCINNTLKELIPTSNSQEASSDMKFKRDFTLGNNLTNIVLDRPINSRDNASINDAKDIQNLRQVYEKPQRPPTPDFLKPQKTNNNREPIIKNNNENNSIIKNNSENNSISNNVDEVPGLSNYMDNDFGPNLFSSLDNINKPLIDDNNILEDTRSFNDRLKTLQTDRNNILIPPSQSNVDFTNNSIDFTNNLVPQQNEMKNIKSLEQLNQLNQFESSPNNNQLNTMNNNQLMNNNDQINNNTLYDNDDHIKNMKDLTYQYEILKIKEQEIKNKLLEINLLSDTVNTTINKYNYLFKTHYLQLEISNNENKSSYIWNLDQPIKDINSIKLMSYSLPVPKYNINKNKNDTLKILINNIEHEIIIPFGFYNINDLINYINNSLKEIIDNNELEEIDIIQSDSEILIDTLNENIKKPKKNNKKKNKNECKPKIDEKYIIFTIDEISQKLNITSNLNIKLISTCLLKNNLGFTSINDDIDKILYADNIWDIRIENKVYLFLRNLSDSIPFGILYFNNMTCCNFNFTEPIVLDRLEIVFVDENGLDYNFYNLKHELNFVIEKNI